MIADTTIEHMGALIDAGPGWYAYAEDKAGRLEAEYPVAYAGLRAWVLRRTGGPSDAPKVYDERNSWRIPRDFGRAPDMRSLAQKRRA